MTNQKPMPARYLRECGHPNDWTLDLKRLDGVIESYCLGCIIQKLGMKPTGRYRLVMHDNKIDVMPVKE